MAPKELKCEGLKDCKKLIADSKDAERIFVLCTGKVDPATGKSWCPDCVKADPVVEKCKEELPTHDVFITCVVGDRPTWKDPNNEFRVDSEFLLKGVPTLMKWGTSERLGDNDCSNEDLVSMLFEE